MKLFLERKKGIEFIESIELDTSIHYCVIIAFVSKYTKTPGVSRLAWRRENQIWIEECGRVKLPLKRNSRAESVEFPRVEEMTYFPTDSYHVSVGSDLTNHVRLVG